ncbi:carbamoyltransferase [Candidatus Omnitrophota bacterium]
MIILGISGLDLDTTVSIVKDGKVIAAVSEERITRKKHQDGFPVNSIKQVLQISGLKISDIDLVSYPFFSGGREIFLIACNFLRHIPTSLHSIFLKNKTYEKLKEVPAQDSYFDNFSKFQSRKVLVKGVRKSARSFFIRYAGNASLISKISDFIFFIEWLICSTAMHIRCDHLLLTNLKKMGLFKKLIRVEHHVCHAASAFYTSGFDRALVVTLDWHGSGLAGSISIADSNGIKRLRSIYYPDSLGMFYAHVTAALGLRINHHEGKIVGLAAYGDPDLLFDIVFDKFYCKEDEFRFILAHDKFFAHRLYSLFPPEHVAAAYQKVLEEVVVRLVKKYVRKYPIGNVALAGGVIGNVKLNQRISEISEIKKVFVHPGMGDMGAGTGAALYIASKHGFKDSYELDNVFWGISFSEKEIEQELSNNNLLFKYEEEIEKRVAELLAAGKVVARFDGGMEYGPRALGNRSILYHACDPKVNEWLNNNLERTEFMPFAPATLYEYRHQCYKKIEKAEYAAEFMTITFDCTDYMKKVSPAAVHIDGTARPQLVKSDKNKKFCKILEEYRRLTGIPSIINTSFNMHEEPIVCTPGDAVRAFLRGHLDYLAIGNFLVKNPYG